jgi:predicted membrane channel-forming protein YqfA (hemolysin III family)
LQESNPSVNLNMHLFETAPNFRDVDYILNYISIIPLSVNLFSACFCLGCSAIYHLLQVKSYTVSTVLARLDYGGISILIFGTAYSLIYYAHACDEVETSKIVWTSCMSIGAGTCFIITFIPDCDKAKCRPAKGIMFMVMGLSSAVVVAYLSVEHPMQ